MDARRIEQSKNPLAVFKIIPDMISDVISGLNAKSYHIILKDNAVIDRFIGKGESLTAEEKACIPE